MDTMSLDHFQRLMGAKSKDEAARIMGVTRRTWYNWIDKGGVIPDPWIYKARYILESEAATRKG